MAKQTLLDKAIAQLEGEKAVLQLAIDKLKSQQQQRKSAPKRTPLKAVADVGHSA